MFTQIFLFHFMVKTFQNPFLPLFERCFVRLGAYSHPDVRDTPDHLSNVNSAHCIIMGAVIALTPTL